MPKGVKNATLSFGDDPLHYEPYDSDDPFEATRDNKVDFDDETDNNQLPLDELEAIELGANLDNPEQLSENWDR